MQIVPNKRGAANRQSLNTTSIGCCGLRSGPSILAEGGYWRDQRGHNPGTSQPIQMPILTDTEAADWLAYDGGSFLELGLGLVLFFPPTVELLSIDDPRLIYRPKAGTPIARKPLTLQASYPQLLGLSGFQVYPNPEELPAWQQENLFSVTRAGVDDLVEEARRRNPGPRLLHATLAVGARTTSTPGQEASRRALEQAGLVPRAAYVNQNTGNLILLLTKLYE